MAEIVFPQGNEKEFVEMARKLGLSKIIFAYPDLRKAGAFDFPVETAIICEPDRITKYKGKALTIVKAPEDLSKLRGVIERGPDIIYGLEFVSKKDYFHHRASGLNHVLAAIMHEKDVKIGFDYSRLISSPSRERSIYLGRMMQNAVFARKFQINMLMASFADDPKMLRSAKDIHSLSRLIGFDGKEERN